MSATVRRRMTRRGSVSSRFSRWLRLSAVVFVATAAALAFSDDSCDNTSLPATDGVVGASYGHKLTGDAKPANGAPYTYLVSLARCPRALSARGTARSRGTPTQSGTYNGVELPDSDDKPEPSAGPRCVTRGPVRPARVHDQRRTQGSGSSRTRCPRAQPSARRTLRRSRRSSSPTSIRRPARRLVR